MNKIIKSENDDREYVWFELQNEMKVILITDNESTSCGALLNVNVGSIHETDPGMAHFLEHMVFMGSEKYPDESNFMDSVGKNGGMTNAMTADTDTTYFFTIGSNNYLKILDMFAWFFIKPLLKKDGIEREVNAVDSEARKNLLDDNWIFQEIFKKTMNSSHPINHFTCGNKDTLKGDDLRDRVEEFFNKYYSSNIMHLILFINKDINKLNLIDIVKNTFGKIQNKQLKLDKKYGDIINAGNIIKYIPNKDIDSVSICFEVPNITNDLIYSQSHLLDWILSSKSENSLFKIYEELGFIIEGALNELFYYDDRMVYYYKIILTELGNTEENINKIIEIFFDYIKCIQTSDKLKSIYDTINQKNLRDFNISSNDDIQETILKFNTLLTRNVNPENLLNYESLRPEYKKLEPIIKKTLQNIRIHNTSIVYSSRKLKLINPEIDEIFKTKFIVDKMEPLKIKGIKYDIINKNRFITNTVNIIDGTDTYPNKNPEIINKKYIFSYNFNSSFKSPFVNTYVQICFPELLKSADIYTQTLLYLDTIYSGSSNIISDLEDAGFTISMSLDINTLIIYIKSDNNNINDIFDIFSSIYLSDNNNSFETTKQKLYKTYNSFENEKPIYKIGSLTSKLLLVNYYTPYDIVPNLNKTFKECRDTFKKISKNGKTTIFMSGNIQFDYAEKMADLLYKYLKIDNEFKDEFPSNLKQVKYPFKKKALNKNKSEKNNIFSLFYEISKLKKGESNWAIYIGFAVLLNALTHNKYFNSLRTKEQIGYIVSTMIAYIGKNNDSICGIKFVVQSPIKKSKYIFKRTQQFIKNELYTYIQGLTIDDFDEYKNGEIASLSEKFNNLDEMDLYLCSHVFDHTYLFDYREQIIDSIRLFDLSKFIELFNKIILESDKYYYISIDSQ